MDIRNSPDDQRIVGNIMGVFSQLKREKEYMMPIWKEITDYLYPRRSGWGFELDMDRQSGHMIFDGAAIAAHNKLSNGLFGWLCSPSIDWLKIVPFERKNLENKKLMEYCRDLEMYLYDVFARSNYYDVLAEDFADCTALGTSVIYADEAKELGRPVYTPLHLREAFISENRYGEVDTLFRDFEMTYRQLVETFGDKLNQETKKAASKNPEAKVRILHAMYPRDVMMDGDLKRASEKAYASVYILQGISSGGGSAGIPAAVSGSVGGGLMIDNGGTDYRHFEAWRFRKASGQVYGHSPAMDAIHDIKMINLQSKSMADVAQLAARPPMQAPESMRGKIKIIPGGMSYSVGGEQITPVMASYSYPIGLDSMQRREQIIREHFMTDFFMAISQLQGTARNRTATEVMEIKAESAAILGAVTGRAQSERIDPIVKMTIAIERAAGRLPEAPRELEEGIKLSVQYIGPLAQAQRKFLRVQGLTQGLGAAAQFAQLDPDIMFNFDIDWAGREIAVANGYPWEGLRDLKETKKMREQANAQRAAAAAAEGQRLNMQAGASAAKAPEPGSPLQKMMEGS